MLFPPKLGEQQGQDAVEDPKPVNQRAVGWAEGDEQFFLGDARPAVVDMEALGAFRSPADAAAEAVALEDVSPPSAEMKQVSRRAA